MLLLGNSGSAGEVALSHTYRLLGCQNSWTSYPTDLPSETDRVWTLTKSRVSGEIRVVVHCNDKEVLNLVLSDTTCISDNWSYYWSRDVEKIKFFHSDTASDYYRPGTFNRTIA